MSDNSVSNIERRCMEIKHRPVRSLLAVVPIIARRRWTEKKSCAVIKTESSDDEVDPPETTHETVISDDAPDAQDDDAPYAADDEPDTVIDTPPAPAVHDATDVAREALRLARASDLVSSELRSTIDVQRNAINDREALVLSLSAQLNEEDQRRRDDEQNRQRELQEMMDEIQLLFAKLEPHPPHM